MSKAPISAQLFLLVMFFPTAIAFAQGPSEREAALVRSIDDQGPAAVALLERIVNMNSGTFNTAGVLEVGKVLEKEFQTLGFATRWVPMDSVKRAPSLIAERKGARGKRVLLIGHMDTVFEASNPFQKFVRTGDSAARGHHGGCGCEGGRHHHSHGGCGQSYGCSSCGASRQAK